MSKPRVLICHPNLDVIGGAGAVGAWSIQALRDDFEVGLCTLNAVDLAAFNRGFGTSLAPGDCELLPAPPLYRALRERMPTAGALLEMSLTVRWALEIDRRRRYDLLFSTSNEVGFDRPGLQYIHFPWAYLPRPDVEVRWFHRIPGVLRAYRAACLRLARGTWPALRQNRTLANSEFTARKIREVHGIDSTVVYPPVPGEFPSVPWEQRRFAVAAVGRLHPGKRWEMAVQIAEAVRRRGHELTLTVIGHPDVEWYGRQLDDLAATRPWFRIERSFSREQLAAAVATHRYGVHCMEDEHFGIAPAELQRAGCITFVHNSGGAVEVVDRDERLTFDTHEDAAAKLARAIEDAALEADLRTQVEGRRDYFCAEKYCDSIRQIVREEIRGI